MALLLAEQVNERGINDKIAIKKVILGSERHSAAMDARIAELLGIDAAEIYDIPGMTELYGPGTGLDCRDHTGIHYWADYYILEILDPETLKPVAEGETGEMVVTTLHEGRRSAAPLSHPRPAPASSPARCACGSRAPAARQADGPLRRHVHLPGRQHLPGADRERAHEVQGRLERVQRHPRPSRRRQGLHADPGGARSRRRRRVKDNEIAKSISGQIKKEIMCSGDIEIVDYMSLPRSDRKSKRVYDNRG